jgi:hypothetical protein
MITQIIDLVHAAIKGVILLYPFFLSRYDWYYLLINVLTVLSWTVFKGECLIHYYVKKYKDPNYVMGSNFKSDGFMSSIDKKYHPFLNMMLLSVKMVGFAYVLLRNSFGIPITSYVLISYYLSISDHYKNKWVVFNTQIVFGAILVHLVLKKLKYKV